MSVTNTEVYTTFRAVFILSNMTSKDFNAIARGVRSETDVIWTDGKGQESGPGGKGAGDAHQQDVGSALGIHLTYS